MDASFDTDKLRTWIDEERLKEELNGFIQGREHLLSLIDHCDNGSPAEEVIEVASCDVYEAVRVIRGTFDVTFDDTFYGGCRDIELSDSYAGTVDFEIDLDSGELRIGHSEIHRCLDEEDGEDGEDEGDSV